MAAVPASTSVDMRKQRRSFAKIAATGIKPPHTQQNHSNHSPDHPHKHDAPSSPQDGGAHVTPSTGTGPPLIAPKHKKLVHLAPKTSEESARPAIGGPRVRVQTVDSAPRRAGEPAPEKLLMPRPDEASTQISSSSDSNKPQSLDGKSVASGTTFALDEKDSLRPDDSASVKAVEEDDIFSPQPGSRLGSSDDGARAFRDQLREITSMEPPRRGPPPQVYGHPPKGVLYVPPQGLGVGPVPNGSRNQPDTGATTDSQPDQKLLEALENPRDRVWVLKLEQDVIDFVKDPKESSLTLPQCHSFYRLLAHKMADYYMLGHLVDDDSSAVRLYKTLNCRIPPPLPGVTAPSTAASTPPPMAPQMKILRRGIDRAGPALANGASRLSKSGSENGESGNEDDKKPKAPVTREEREARYEAARLRIMGSAKPTESPEAAKEKEDSRSSSATGRKNKKKQRADSDDGFEARSAYSNYLTSSFGSDGMAAPSYGLRQYTDGTNGHFMNPYSQQVQTSRLSKEMIQSPHHGTWTQQPLHHADSAPAWAQGQSSAYDLSADFQRTMNLQQQVPSPTGSSPYSAIYGQQYYNSQPGWSQPQYQPPPPTQSGYGYNSAFMPSPGHVPHDQPYAFGQLPSQAFPGRPSSKTEHPLPGSYKGKHFNPQSQAFIPSQANGSPFTPPGMPPTHNTFASGLNGSAQLQRQNSIQSQGSAFESPHHSSPLVMPSRIQAPPLTHPLPQGPVYPRQPSPSVPLPPKPGSISMPHRPSDQPPLSTSIAPASLNFPHQSVLAKWGAPPSLPAKPPPPSAELFDAPKLSQVPRPAYTNSAIATVRQPSAVSPGFPTFGSMPPPTPLSPSQQQQQQQQQQLEAGGVPIVNGSGGASVNRS